MEALAIKNLSFSYNGSQEKVLKDINLFINTGEFVLLCGKTGCGKSTFLRLLKPLICPCGNFTGDVLFEGKDITSIEKKEQASLFGFVFQNPNDQIVCQNVFSELAFGLENVGFDPKKIRLKVFEMASFFGMNSWLFKKTDELSGGEKQILNLASVMVLNPKVLLLDEPTSMLDPIGADRFFSILKKLHDELSVTIIIAEHHLEEVFAICDRVLGMDDGKIVLDKSPRDVKNALSFMPSSPIKAMLPTFQKVFMELNLDENPLSIREGREVLKAHFSPTVVHHDDAIKIDSTKTCLSICDVFFRYNKTAGDVLKGVDLKVKCGEIFCILGENGCGKSTLLDIISKISIPYRGAVKINGKNVKKFSNEELYSKTLSYLMQDVTTAFVADTLENDFFDFLLAHKIPTDDAKKMIDDVALKFKIKDLLLKNPLDLSGGQMQKCAILKLTMLRPDILLLDEPTKGIDQSGKEELKNLLLELRKGGTTVLIVTHDIEFAANVATRCALLAGGEIVLDAPPSDFFLQNNFYTTSAAKMSSGVFDGAVTCEDIIKAAREQLGE